LKGSKKGNVFITTQKVIFAPTTGCSYGSFSMNFHSIRNVEVSRKMWSKVEYLNPMVIQV